MSKKFKQYDTDEELVIDSDIQPPQVKWVASLGQAAALATKHHFLEARFNPDTMKPGQVQYGFTWSKELELDAGNYFLHKLQVDALDYWDKCYEFKTIKHNLMDS